MIVKRDISEQSLLKVFSGVEAMGVEDIGNAAVETLDHAVNLRLSPLDQWMFNPQSQTKLVKLVVSGWLMFLATKEIICEFLATIGQYFCDLYRAGLVQGDQERFGAACAFLELNRNKNPTDCPVNRHEEIATFEFIRHLRQLFDIDMDIARLISFQCVMQSNGLFGFQRVEVPHTVTHPIKIRFAGALSDVANSAQAPNGSPWRK